VTNTLNKQETPSKNGSYRCNVYSDAFTSRIITPPTFLILVTVPPSEGK